MEENYDDNTEEVLDEVENTDSLNGEESDTDEASDDSSTEDTSDGSEDVQRLKEENERLKQKNKQLFERAKKSKTVSNTSDFLEERLELIASGADKEVIKEAVIIAKAKGLTLDEAMKDPLISAYQAQLKVKRRSEQAALGASGGGTAKSETVFREGMTQEEHKAAWAKYTGRA